MYTVLSPFLPYFSAVNIAVFFFAPVLRKWVLIAGALLFIALTSAHLLHPESVGYTKFLVFNFISVIPVAFLSFFGPLPILALRNLRSDNRQPPLKPRVSRSGIPFLTKDELSDFVRGSTPAQTLLIAMGMLALVSMAVLMFFAIGATSIGWRSTLVSLYFLLSLLHPKDQFSGAMVQAVVSMLLYFLSAGLAIGGLTVNERFLHFSIEAQTQNYLLVWPEYADADRMFFAVCIFTILFQLRNAIAAART